MRNFIHLKVSEVRVSNTSVYKLKIILTEMFFFSFFFEPGLELMTSHLPGKHSATMPSPETPKNWEFLRDCNCRYLFYSAQKL